MLFRSASLESPNVTSADPDRASSSSVSLILTDPPYEEAADPLFAWLGDFAARVLIPGGSLVCFTGHHRLLRDAETFRAAGLRYWWLLTLMHDQYPRLPGKFVIAGFKPALWFVKARRRDSRMVHDVLKSGWRNKDGHTWDQGEGGIAALATQLTNAGDTVVDPFCGTGEWGEICAALGCKWIGADVVEGGSMRIVL